MNIMKKTTVLFLVNILVIHAFTQNLVLVPTANKEETKAIFQNSCISICYHCDEFVIGTTSCFLKEKHTILDNKPWSENTAYYIVFFNNIDEKTEYVNLNRNSFKVLYDNVFNLIVKTTPDTYRNFQPPKSDGLIHIDNHKAKLPNKGNKFPVVPEANPFVEGLLQQVTGANITNTVQHLQDYGTRNSYKPQSIEAQNWIKGEFENLGLTVELQDFSMPMGPASDNVIATKLGTKYPNEVVMLGAHYDSYSNTDNQPGADDNASGTAAVLEIARILSQYNFDRTIIFCAFSGEEYGLYGSAAYASRCSQEGMNILGYFNLDMIGYLKPFCQTVKTSLIYPQTALELANFYTNVCNVYLPDFVVEPGVLIGGSSDHASFNNNGYMGIFPFEDVDNYSPYIHTVNDIVGLSYNNQSMAVVFTKAALASVVTLSNMRFPPKNLMAIASDNAIELVWDNMEDASYFKVYKNQMLYDSTTTNYFADFEVVNEISYQYFVTAFFPDTNSESGKSNTVTAKPSITPRLPVFYDFENNLANWHLEGGWGLSTTNYHSPTRSLTDSPNGNYESNCNTSATFGPINLIGYKNTQLSFWTKYDIETNYDKVYLEFSSNGQNWSRIDQFSGMQTEWVQKSYPLINYQTGPVFIRFNFISDVSVNRDGIYIDDFEITATENEHMQPIKLYSGWNGVSSYLSPTNTNIEEITQSISNNLVIIQDEINSYQPETNINTISNWDTSTGYKAKLSNNSLFWFFGNKIENRTINLNKGWNIMPVISECNVDCEQLFAGIQHIVAVKEIGSTGVYWPSENIATLYYLQPGKAYYILTSDNVAITFPGCNGDIKVANNKNITNYPWSMDKPSGNSHIIGIPKQVLQSLDIGDKIGVFTAQGKCAGAITVENHNYNTALVAFAKDSTDNNPYGFVDGELILFKVFKTSTGLIYNYIPQYSHLAPDTELFNSKGISLLTKLNQGEVGMQSAEYKINISPNPTRDYVFIDLPDNNKAILEIISISGECLRTETICGKTQIETTTLPTGIYFFKVMGKKQLAIEKIIIL